jgi:anti-anti-sigma factor
MSDAAMNDAAMNDGATQDREVVVLGPARVLAAAGSPMVLAVSGELDLTNADRFALVLRESERPLVVDLGNVTYFDSSALRVVITEHLERPLVIIAPPGSIARRVIEVTGALNDAVRDSLD